MLIIYLSISAFVCAWFAVALVDMGSFHSAFGYFKYLLFSRWFKEEDHLLFIDIIDDNGLSAWQQNDRINEDVYWHVAKRNKLAYLLMCPYCLATWLYIINMVMTYFYFAEFYLIYFPIYLALGVSLIYFLLNFVKK